MRQGSPLFPLPYVIAADALGYLSWVAIIQRQMKGIQLPGGNEILNVHFANDSTFSSELLQALIANTMKYLETFSAVLGAKFIDCKTNTGYN
jgi:hypothetical protein